MVHSRGATVVDTLDNTRTIRNMATELSNGQTEGNTLESGSKVSSTERAYTSKKGRRDKASGRWAKGLSGSNLKTKNDEQIIFSY